MKPDQSPISAALADGSKTFMALAVVSGIINILMLTGSVFMIQIYDRVLVSRSLPTLIAFSAMAVAAYLFQGVPDIIRARVLALIGEAVDAKIGTQLYKAVAELPLRSDRPGQETRQPFRDLDAIRGFLAGAGPIALFDMPWLPVYLLLCYFLHPLLCLAALLAALVLLGITVTAELAGGAPTRRALQAQRARRPCATRRRSHSRDGNAASSGRALG